MRRREAGEGERQQPPNVRGSVAVERKGKERSTGATSLFRRDALGLGAQGVHRVAKGQGCATYASVRRSARVRSLTKLAGGAQADDLGDLEHVRHVRRVHQLVLSRRGARIHFDLKPNVRSEHTSVARKGAQRGFSLFSSPRWRRRVARREGRAYRNLLLRHHRDAVLTPDADRRHTHRLNRLERVLCARGRRRRGSTVSSLSWVGKPIRRFSTQV